MDIYLISRELWGTVSEKLDRARRCGYDLHYALFELNRELRAIAEPITEASLLLEHSYCIPEVHENATAIRDGRAIAHTQEIYCCQYAYNGNGMISPWTAYGQGTSRLLRRQEVLIER